MRDVPVFHPFLEDTTHHLWPSIRGDMFCEVKEGLDGLSRHFLDVHGVGLALSKKADLARCLQDFNLVVIGSVRPPATPEEELACRQRLDRLEADMQHRLRCMQENGGMCLRDENARKRKK